MEILATIREALMQRIQWVARLGLLCALAISQSACSATPAVKTVEWREEVKLANSKIIILERATEYRRVSEPGRGTGWLAAKERVQTHLDSPINVNVSWEGSLQPISLDATDQGEVYIVGVITTAQGQREYALPQGSYHIALKSTLEGHWEQVPLTAVPKQFKPNLLVGTYGLFITNKFSSDKALDLSFKSKVDANPRIVPQFRRWSRE